MADTKTVLAGVCKGLAELINSCGLEPVGKSGEIKDDNGKCAVEYKGEGKALRFEYFNKKISVSAAVKEDGEIIDSDYRQYDSWLLDPRLRPIRTFAPRSMNSTRPSRAFSAQRPQSPSRASSPPPSQRRRRRAARYPMTPTPSATASPRSTPS